VSDGALKEISGIAASTKYPGMYWVHNDSGEKSGRIFLIDGAGKLRATVDLPTAKPRDWEEIAVGPGPEPDKSYIYIGDIGNNAASSNVDTKIYRLPEPSVTTSGGGSQTVKATDPVDTLRFTYSGSASGTSGARDAEAFVVDPRTRDLYLITKREADKVNLYKMAYPQSTSTTNKAEFLRYTPFAGVVGASMSKDGRGLLVKNYSRVFFYPRVGEESLDKTLDHEAEKPPYRQEPQGEAISFTSGGEGFVTLSEGERQPLLYYAAKERCSTE
jgi:hypothetical protein